MVMGVAVGFVEVEVGTVEDGILEDGGAVGVGVGGGASAPSKCVNHPCSGHCWRKFTRGKISIIDVSCTALVTLMEEDQTQAAFGVDDAVL